MRFQSSGNRYLAQRASGQTHSFNKAGRPLARTGFLAVAVSTVLAGGLSPQSPEPQSPSLNQSISLPASKSPPAANGVSKMGDQQNRVKAFEADIERKRQIADESAMLLKLATELKTAVEKTPKDTLSIGIIRKADEIERLAHGVKEKMKVTVAAN